MRGRNFGPSPYRRWQRLYNPPILQAKDALFKKLSGTSIGFALDTFSNETIRITVPAMEDIRRIKEEVLEGKSEFHGFRVIFESKGHIIE